MAIALAHYHFETIHPFLDGNGRLGRLLIVFLMVEPDLLPQPLLYLSSFFEAHRSDYYDRLQAVRERGEIHEWLRFFLAGDRSRATEVVEMIFENPVLTTTRAAEELSVTPQSALYHVRRLEGAAIVIEVAGVPGRSKRWVAPDVLRVLGADDGPFAFRSG